MLCFDFPESRLCPHRLTPSRVFLHTVPSLARTCRHWLRILYQLRLKYEDILEKERKKIHAAHSRLRDDVAFREKYEKRKLDAMRHELALARGRQELGIQNKILAVERVRRMYQAGLGDYWRLRRNAWKGWEATYNSLKAAET